MASEDIKFVHIRPEDLELVDDERIKKQLEDDTFRHNMELVTNLTEVVDEEKALVECLLCGAQMHWQKNGAALYGHLIYHHKVVFKDVTDEYIQKLIMENGEPITTT